MPQRIRFTLTTAGSDGSAIAQSDVYLVNGYLVSMYAKPGDGQASPLTLVARDDDGVLMTSSVTAEAYDTDGSETRTIAERPIVGALVVQASAGNDDKTVEVHLTVEPGASSCMPS